MPWAQGFATLIGDLGGRAGPGQDWGLTSYRSHLTPGPQPQKAYKVVLFLASVLFSFNSVVYAKLMTLTMLETSTLIKIKVNLRQIYKFYSNRDHL